MLIITGGHNTQHSAPSIQQHPIKELLLLLSSFPFNENDHARLGNIISVVGDWGKLIELVNAHGIIALAAYNIKVSGLEKEIPSASMAALENGYMKSVVRNAWLTERWKETNTILSDAGMKHILLKGMALEHTVYGSKGLRQMTDNDILIKPEESLRAWYLLQEKGFAPKAAKSFLHKKSQFVIGDHLPALYRDGYAVEIHQKLPDLNTEATHPFETAVEFEIGGIKALMLSKELHLKFLIRHFEKHALGGHCQLRLYTDIKLLDKENKLSFPDEFILNPLQENDSRFLKTAYKSTVLAIPAKHRLRFITGDIFPSLNWMKRRYNCSGTKALLYYPARTMKMFWLI